MQDEKLVRKVNKIMRGEVGENFSITQDGLLTMKSRICLPDMEDLRKMIMEEAHYSAYAMHPDSTKMYRTIKKNYWWSGIKNDIIEFLSRCLVCQQVKVEHQKPPELFNLYPYPYGSENKSP